MPGQYNILNPRELDLLIDSDEQHADTHTNSVRDYRSADTESDLRTSAQMTTKATAIISRTSGLCGSSDVIATMSFHVQITLLLHIKMQHTDHMH